MKADDKQISGNHYKEMSIQPWTYVHANNLGYFEGSAIKYITRWRNKGGVADIQKAIHFLEKLIELESPTVDSMVLSQGKSAYPELERTAKRLHPAPSMASAIGDTYRPPSDYRQELNKVNNDWVTGLYERNLYHGG